MRRSRFTHEQIMAVLKEGTMTTVKKACANHHISPATYYGWKRRYAKIDGLDAERLRMLEEENARLKRLVADQAVQIQILKEVKKRKW